VFSSIAALKIEDGRFERQAEMKTGASAALQQIMYHQSS
jgi:hypothetical protein